MELDIINTYIDRVYGYSIKHTFTREEADELSQEILCTALRQLSTLKDEARFEPWLWGLAANVTHVFRRKQGRQRAMYSFDSLEGTVHYDSYAELDEDRYAQVRAKIASLSKMYRDIIVLHYYDNLTCREISKILGIPEGTVTWRLSEGRNKLKKECINMTETALKPVAMTIGINGGGNYNDKDRPFPGTLVSDALSQNVLYHCYKEPNNVEELSKLCGVPAYYIEDAVKNLLHREALTEPMKGKYLTDFLIFDDTQNEYNSQAITQLDSNFLNEYVTLLKDFMKKVIGIGVETGGKPESELIYLYGLLALYKLSNSYNPFPPVPYRVRYDGNEWTFQAHIANTYRVGGMRAVISSSLEYGGTCTHSSFQFAGFGYRPPMGDRQIYICEKLLNASELTEEEKEHMAVLIKDGYLSNDAGCIKRCFPSFTLIQKSEFDRIAEDHFNSFMPKYTSIIKWYADGYRKLFPKRLKEDVDRTAHFLFVSFFTHISIAAQEKGLLEKPASDHFCDVLVQMK
jgi:RNA polymerase sigma factor (sigma-70 family)